MTVSRNNLAVFRGIILPLIASFLVSEAATSFNYPAVRRDESVIDEYHGTKVLVDAQVYCIHYWINITSSSFCRTLSSLFFKIADPYRFLEDPDSDETKAFIAAQNNVTFTYLENAPFRKELRNKLTELWNYPRRGIPKKRGSKYFYFANSGLQNQW